MLRATESYVKNDIYRQFDVYHCVAHNEVQILHRRRIVERILLSVHDDMIMCMVSIRIFALRTDFIRLIMASSILLAIHAISVLRRHFNEYVVRTTVFSQLSYSTLLETLYRVVRHTVIVRIKVKNFSV
jgi:hypothetical protein